jgi:hypothetical protein
MRALSAGELLATWEWGLGREPLSRGLALLLAGCPELSSEELLNLTLGQRDATLLALRELTFGPQLRSRIVCPACGESLELNLLASELLALASPLQGPAAAEYQLEQDGWQVTFRLLNSLDLLATLGEGDTAAARRELLGRCVLAAAPPGDQETAGLPESGLPGEVEAVLFERIQQLDAAGSLSFSLTCPSCQHTWTAPFDIISFFWREIEAWGYRTLREVHLLAAAYGWRETDILALSPWRRQAYLEMTGYA